MTGLTKSDQQFAKAERRRRPGKKETRFKARVEGEAGVERQVFKGWIKNKNGARFKETSYPYHIREERKGHPR